MRITTPLIIALLAFLTAPASAAETGNAATGNAAGNAAEWPEFHGPRRDNISTEKGLLKQWPEGGPRMIWKYDKCGVGFSGFAIVDGMIFTAGDFDDDEMLFALTTDGKLVWKSRNGKSWQGSSPGCRTTPTYVDGVLYHMNPTGTIGAFEAKSGKPIWSVDLKSRFGTRFGTWAMSENLIVDGDKVFCLPGGTKGSVVALDKRSGKTIWANAEMDGRAAYCSPIIVTHGGTRQLITMTQRAAVGIDVKTGKLLWSHPHGRYGQNTTPPTYHDGHVFIACGHSAGGRLLKINPDSRGVTQVWYKKELDNCHGDVILIDGRLYGSGCRLGGKSLFCVDFLTGKTKHSDRSLGKVSLTYADGMLYSLSNKLEMSLLEITPDGFKVVSQFEIPKGGEGPSLCHPIICGGRLYLRHDQCLYVYDIKAK